MRPTVRVVTASESAARDAAAIAAGVPSRALMQRAGAAAAAEIALRFHDRLDEGVLILAGPGNNGGDAWVVARALAESGVSVSVVEPVEAKTPDARAERALALECLPADRVSTGRLPERFGVGVGIVVDGFFGTGGTARLDGLFAEALHHAREARRGRAVNVALDIVSGIDATTGDVARGAVAADLTISFGTVKRGQLVNRDLSGIIAVVDIGLCDGAAVDDAPMLVGDRWADAHIPRARASTHKGERGKLAIVGGHAGMAGAAMLAARGAFRSGIGMVKLVVARESVPVIQEAEPQALAAAWPADDDAVRRDIVDWADAVVIGPGLGRGEESSAVLDRVLRVWRGPVLIDADAITRFTGAASQLERLLGGRPAILTPHVVEFARLADIRGDDIESRRFDVGADLARRVNATVLLKGVPTVITTPGGERIVSAAGTPALATGGSGDVLSGVVGTLLAQTGDPLVSGALGAFAHGRAAERVAGVGGPRGTSLDDVVAELRGVWEFDVQPLRYPLLAELPAIAR